MKKSVKFDEEEMELLNKLIKSKIGEIRAHIILGEPIEQRMAKVNLIGQLNNIQKKLE